jgi:hypothetical protein
MTHVATFSDWACARMPDTIGKRQTLRRHDDVFGGLDPYSTATLRDEFGVHCKLANSVPPPLHATVTAVAWGDGEAAPAEMRQWFRDRKVFGFVARVEGPRDLDGTKRLLAAADLRVLLVADGAPTLGVGLDAGSFWWCTDHAWVVVPFGPADRRDLRKGAEYRFVPRNQNPATTWRIGDGVRVPRRSCTSRSTSCRRSRTSPSPCSASRAGSRQWCCNAPSMLLRRRGKPRSCCWTRCRTSLTGRRS